MSEEEQKQEAQNNNRKKWLVIGLLVLFLLGNLILVYQLMQTSSELDETREELVTTEDLKEDLEREIQDLELELEDYQDRLHEKDTALENRNAELREMATELEEAVRERDLSRQELAEKREELGRLRYYTEKYQSQIDSLERENVELREEKEQYAEDLEEEKRRYDRVKDENVLLENKVSIAARLETKELEASGIRYSAIRDRERSTTRKSRMEEVRVCFTIEENVVAESGNKNLYFRLMNPEGSTVNIQEAGSGNFEHQGEEFLYTTVYQMNYQNEEYSDCVYWPHTGQLQEGENKVEIYAEGHKIGETQFRIR